MLCSFFPKIESKEFYLYNISKITLKIKGIGNKNVLGIYNNDPSSIDSFQEKYFPNLVYINGIIQNYITYRYDFNLTDNFVELIWNNNINNCVSMFRNCSDIVEMDFSDFDTSEVTSMQFMFVFCSSLTSLNLSNFHTSKVEIMWGMFHSCSSLTSLNLSNFDTSKVESMQCMFCFCSSLTSMNLSNFDTSELQSMLVMFVGCNNLEYINLKNFNENQLSKYEDMFVDVPSNVVVCMNEHNTIILSELIKKKCYTIDCSDDWKLKQKKNN